MEMNEIASLARSKHRCQAFGTSRDRGERFEYLELLKGEWRDDLFDSYEGVGRVRRVTNLPFNPSSINTTLLILCQTISCSSMRWNQTGAAEYVGRWKRYYLRKSTFG